jgi:hypothetical protein
MDLVRTVILGAVQRDEQGAVRTAHLRQAAALLQFRQDIAEHGVKHRRIDRVELGADLAVAGDFAQAEQGLAVRAALAGLQMALMRQERRGLHEECANAASTKSAMGSVALRPRRKSRMARQQRRREAKRRSGSSTHTANRTPGGA